MNEPTAWITTSWDDGHSLDVRIAEMLDRHGLTGTFYAPRNADTGVMSPAELRDVATRHEVGGHTMNHVSLTAIDDAQAQREIAESRQWVEDVTGQTCAMFCPPRGKFAAHHVEMAAAAGYAGLRTVELLSTELPRNAGPIPVMPTTLQVYPHDSAAYLRNAAKRRSVRGIARCLLSVRGRGWLQLVDPMLDHVIRCGGVFHLWGHAWEIDRLDQWDALDQAMTRLASRLGEAQCMTNGALCASVCNAGAA